jgi:hypothetical protein
MAGLTLQKMTEEQRLTIRKACLRSLYTFCKTVMGYDDIEEKPHGEFCRFLETGEARKQACMPRSFVKTWISTIAYSVWIALPRSGEDEFPEGISPDDKYYGLGTNIRILVASYVVSNAEKMIGLIRKTYESNVAMQILFPEVIPDNFKKQKWSNQSACINRPDNFTESTFEAAGIGGSSTSRHYDLIIEDDLIYANKDDFSGRELQPNQEDIDKAIGWHKIATSLLVPGKHTHIHNTGTRWAKHDLVDYIWSTEPSYVIFRRACVQLSDAILSGKETSVDIDWTTVQPTWESAYDHTQLKMIATAQGPYMFATQYLLMPMSPEELLFKPRWLQYYKHISEVPKDIRVFTTVDLSEWGNDTRKSTDCNSVVLTCGWCPNNHMWLLGYDVGRFSPTEVIFLMAKHWKLYNPEAIYPESVYYQKSLAHFAREYVKMGKVPAMTVRELLPESNKSKDLRIRGLEPLASNEGIHCREDQKEFITEYSEYIPTNRLCKKDILDAAAYQVQIARPGVVIPIARQREDNVAVVYGTADELLKHCWEGESKKDTFGNEMAVVNQYSETEVGTGDWLDGIQNPFEQES